MREPSRGSQRSAAGASRPIRPLRRRWRSRPIATSVAWSSRPSAQHLDDAARFRTELVAEVPGALGREPAQAHRRVDRRGRAEARVGEAVERVVRAPGLRVVEQRADARIDQRAALERALQLLQVQRAADLRAIEQHRGGVAPAGIADGIEFGAAAIEVAADAGAQQSHLAGQEKPAPSSIAADTGAVEVQRRAAQAAGIELGAHMGATGTQVAMDARCRAQRAPVASTPPLREHVAASARRRQRACRPTCWRTSRWPAGACAHSSDRGRCARAPGSARRARCNRR